MKKKVFISITILFVFIAIGLNTQIFNSLNELSNLSAKYQVTTDRSKSEHYVLISPDEFSQEWKNIIRGATFSADKYNTVIEVLEIDNYSIELQLDYMETAIAAKVDGLIIDSNNMEIFDYVINKAVVQGVKVAILNEDRPGTLRTINIANNEYNEGQKAGEILSNNDDEGIVLVIEEVAYSDSHDKTRIDGIMAYNDKYDIKYKVIEVDNSTIKEAKTQLREYLKVNKIRGIFATTPEVTLLTAETLERLGIDIPLVGIGDSFDIKNLIRDNRIDYAFVDNHFLIGEKSIEHLIDNNEGQFLIDSLILNKMNVDQVN